MKKTVVFVLLGLLALFMLTGCGKKKTEEQQAVEEIQQHIMEEAAEDGVDLQAMLQQEAAESMARTEAREQEREEKTRNKEELDAYYGPLLQTEFDALIAAADPVDTIEHGQHYNELLSERIAKGNEAGVGCSYKALDASYYAKALYLAFEEYSGYDSSSIYEFGDIFDYKTARILLKAEKTNEYSYPYEMLFIKKDLSVCKLDLSAFFDPETAVMPEKISESFLELCAIENGDWNFYLFDISASEGTLVCSSTDSDEETYRNKVEEAIPGDEMMGETYEFTPLEGNSLENLNTMIIRKASGTAVETYMNY